MHLDLFKVFSDLASTKSFSKAAAQNYITQSAVSQQVAFLETRLGKRLVKRSKKSLTLTEEGNIFLKACVKILETYHDASLKIKHPGKITGSVRIETVYSVGLYSLALYEKTFLKRHPLINLHIEYNRSDEIYTNVLEEKCDMGIVAYPSQRPMLRILPFKRERLVLVCAPDNPLAAQKIVRLADINRERFIAFAKDVPTRKGIDDILSQHKILVDIRHEFDNIETIKRAVEVGSGISILPDNAVQSEAKSKTLMAIPIAGKALYRPIGIILNHEKPISNATKIFLDWLAK